jgi:hypothetical protein
VGGLELNPPSGFSWQNQSTATTSTTNGGEILISAVGASGNNVNGRYVAYPTPPFTRTFCGKIKTIAAASTSIVNANGGLYLSDGTKAELFNIYGQGLSVGISTGPSATNINANVVGSGGALSTAGSDFFCLRLDDGVTTSAKRTFFISVDGITFLQFYQESNSQFMTPTRIGYFANAYDTNSHVEVWALGWQ